MEMDYTTELVDNHANIGSGNISINLNCPNLTQYDIDIMDAFSYWVGGVALCCISIPGLLMNLTAIYVLSTRGSFHQNTFFALLVSLFVFDSMYLFFETIETFRRRFHYETRIHTILLPQFTYPFTIISLAASIFMTMGIAHERYDAIKRPVVHRQSMRSNKFRRIKFIKYILAVSFCAIFFNIPKFFEVELKWEYPMWDMAANQTQNR